MPVVSLGSAEKAHGNVTTDPERNLAVGQCRLVGFMDRRFALDHHITVVKRWFRRRLGWRQAVIGRERVVWAGSSVVGTNSALRPLQPDDAGSDCVAVSLDA